MTGLAARRVSPFGHPGITAHVQLPQAYRSLSRPSSPLDAKASTVCLIAFDLKSLCSSVRTQQAASDQIPHTRRMPARAGIRQHHPSLNCQRAKRKASEKAECGRLPRLFRAGASPRLLEISRKEVIQPQVPLRLPCYDFAPVTELTFDGCLSCELAHRLQVPPASMA
jgi:hypothetical protein